LSDGDEISIRARTISGFGRQIKEAMQFAPLLIGAIFIGFGLLLLNFWLANWKPSMFRGCFAILCFVSAPMTALLIWLRWKSRPEASDSLLVLHSDSLVIRPLGGDDRDSTRIPWERLKAAKFRFLHGRHQALRVTAQSDVNPLLSTVIEFALCDAPDAAERFKREFMAKQPQNKGYDGASSRR
jgi:hypothetical protein